MDLSKLLKQLRSEVEHLDAAIQCLEQLQAKGARRGRPPKALVEIRKEAKAGIARPRRTGRKNSGE